VTSDPLEL